MNGEQNQGGMGPLIGSIIIVILLLAGGYYSWISSIALDVELSPVPGSSNTQPSPAISAPAKPAQQSTEITDIEADAIAVDTTTIDSGLENLDLLIK